MNERRLYADFHVIQTLPPSNVNRDDTGSPKTAVYGGARRARVSSQSWKRAMRKYFSENSSLEVGVRTLNVGDYVAGIIQQKDASKSPEEALKLADQVLNNANVKSKDGKVKALFFLGKQQAEQLAEEALNGSGDKNKVKEILKSNPAVDIALFGRMVADDPSLNEDASAQVAHAISTHAVQTEFDFYTAVDDLAPEDNAGAGMLGTVEYNSSTLYRYANVAIHEFSSQMNDDKDAVIKALKLFAESFVNSMPTGKINTFANQTVPQFIMINIREDRPVNLVSAFEKPVRSSKGYVEASIERLCEELDKAEKIVHPALDTIYLPLDGVSRETLGTAENDFTSLMDDFEAKLSELL
ncbi:MAG: type I-E CRISPR-associated protein Cas7/Cse4/CasC [Anaerovoracaceae bacterium]|jgi:CRISPR system Cascade subunit CasC